MKSKIKILRKGLSLRQEDFANLLGVTRQTIIAIENDKYNPMLELISWQNFLMLSLRKFSN